MQVYDISNPVRYKMTHNTNQPKTFREEFATMLPASIKQIEQAETGGEALGFTMVPKEGKQVVYGMSARLSEKSTADNPIVQIRSNLNGENKVYLVEIHKINPQHASQMEMFALCSYADYIGEGTGSTFGSYHTLRIMQDTAQTSGVTPTVNDGMSAVDNFMNAKKDWVQICKQACDLLKDVSEMRVRDLFMKGKKLTGLLERQGF
jgi:hypothetical protein